MLFIFSLFMPGRGHHNCEDLSSMFQALKDLEKLIKSCGVAKKIQASKWRHVERLTRWQAIFSSKPMSHDSPKILKARFVTWCYMPIHGFVGRILLISCGSLWHSPILGWSWLVLQDAMKDAMASGLNEADDVMGKARDRVKVKRILGPAVAIISILFGLQTKVFTFFFLYVLYYFIICFFGRVNGFEACDTRHWDHWVQEPPGVGDCRESSAGSTSKPGQRSSSLVELHWKLNVGFSCQCHVCWAPKLPLRSCGEDETKAQAEKLKDAATRASVIGLEGDWNPVTCQKFYHHFVFR